MSYRATEKDEIMNTPVEIIANRVINTAIRNGELAGWDTVPNIGTMQVHELIVRAVQLDREERTSEESK